MNDPWYENLTVMDLFTIWIMFHGGQEKMCVCVEAVKP